MYIDIIDSDVLAAAFSAQDVVIATLLGSGTGDVLDCDILDHNSVGGVSGRATVEVILLNVDAVNIYIRDAYVLEKNVRYEACGVGVAFDACAVLGVQYDGVGEGDVGDVVVRLSAHGANRKAVAAVAVHVVDVDIVTAGYSHLTIN
jgi:hypothetical protein